MQCKQLAKAENKKYEVISKTMVKKLLCFMLFVTFCENNLQLVNCLLKDLFFKTWQIILRTIDHLRMAN